MDVRNMNDVPKIVITRVSLEGHALWNYVIMWWKDCDGGAKMLRLLEVKAGEIYYMRVSMQTNVFIPYPLFVQAFLTWISY